MQEIAVAKATTKFPSFLETLAMLDLLILDDWGINALAVDEREDLLEVLEDRYNLRSTAIISRRPRQRNLG